MKILFLVPYVPSLVRVRPFNLIRHLASRGHHVTVATVWTGDGDRDELLTLKQHGAEVRAVGVPAWRSLLNCGRALTTGEPLQARYSWSEALLGTVGDDERFDVVHVEHLRGARYGLAAGARWPATPIVWDSVDCITSLFAEAARHRRDRVGRLISRFELARTRGYEGRLVPRFDRVLVTSAADKQALLDLSMPRGRADDVTVLTNGVDLEYFGPGAGPRNADTLVFSGKMSYHANETAAVFLIDEVMPRIWARRPSTRLVVVGRDPSPRLRRLLARESERILVTGAVADMRPHLREASIAVVPLVYGVGCQNKVLEAMACATPVVATSLAVAALQAQSGRDVLVADQPQAFAGAVLGLLDSSSRRREVGEAGRRYVEAHHRWESVAMSLETVYEEALATRRLAHSDREWATEVSQAGDVERLRPHRVVN